MAIGDVVVRLQADSAEFKAGIERAKGSLDDFSAATVAKFGVIVGAAAELGSQLASGLINGLKSIPNAINETIDQFDKLQKISEKTGVEGGLLQALALQAKLADVDLQSLSGGLIKFQRTLFDAGKGGEESARIFRGLGIDIKAALADPSDGLVKTLDALSKIKNEAVGTGASAKLLGKEVGPALRAAFADGAEGIARSGEELRKWGALASNETLARAASFKDTLEKIRVAGSAIRFALTEAALPALDALAQGFLKAKDGGNALADSIREIGRDGTLFTWAISAVEAVKSVGEGFLYLRNLVGTVTDGIAKAVIYLNSGIDLKEAGEKFSTFGLLFSGETRDRARAAVASIEKNRNDALADLTAQATARGQAESAFSRAMDRFIQNARSAYNSAQSAAGGRRDSGGAPDLSAFSGPAKHDPFDSELASLVGEAAKLQSQIQTFDEFRGSALAAKSAVLEVELAIGKFSDTERARAGLAALSEAQKEMVRGLTKGIGLLDLDLQQEKTIAAIGDRISAIKAETEGLKKGNVERQVAVELEKLIKAGISPNDAAFKKRADELRKAITDLVRERENLQVADFTRGERDYIDSLRFETDQLTATAEETKKLTEFRRLDKALRDATTDATGKRVVLDDTFDRLEAAVAAQKKTLTRVLDDRREAERDALNGSKIFFRDYIEESTNASKQVQSALGNIFQGLQGQLETLLATGKITAKGVADVFLTEFRRMLARDLLTSLATQLKGILNDVKSIQGAGSGGGGLLSALFGSIIGRSNAQTGAGGAAGGGGAADPGVQVFSAPDPGANITVAPLAFRAARSADGPAVTLYQTVNIDSRTDQAVVQQIAQNAARQAVAAFRTQLARGAAAVPA